MGTQFCHVSSRLNGTSKTHRAPEEEAKCSGREGNVICYVPGYVSLKENYLVPTDSDTYLEIYLYFIKSNKLLLIDHKAPG